MTNNEKYKKAFSTLQISNSLSWEVEHMANLKRRRKLKTIAACIAACLIISITGTVAYAKNVGGIQRTVQLWFHGDQTDATLDVRSDGSYSVDYPGGVEQSGGGVVIEDDGSERPLNEAELKEELEAPEVDYQDDGTVYVYYRDQKIDITDKFNEDGICYVKVTSDDKTYYITASKDANFGFSTDKYMSPEEIMPEPEDPEDGTSNSSSISSDDENASSLEPEEAESTSSDGK